MKKTKDVYVSPQIEVVEFKSEENIAMSNNLGPGVACGEEVG